MLIGLAGLILQALLQDADTVARLLPGFLCFGISLALVYAPMSTAAMAAMPPERRDRLGRARDGPGDRRGAAAGAVERCLSGLVPGEHPSPTELAEAVTAALVPAIVVVAIAAALTWLLVRAPGEPRSPGPDELEHHQHHRRFHL